MTKTAANNVYIFMGEDDFSMQKKVELWRAEFAKKYAADSITIVEAEGLSERELINKLLGAVAPSLFSTKKLIVVRDGLPSKAEQKDLADTIVKIAEELPKDSFLVFWQTKKMDKRLAVTKQILKSNITLNEFTLPHGAELDAWIMGQAKLMGSNIENTAAQKLGEFLGRDLYEEKKVAGRVVDRKEAFNLWQAHSELQKLTTYSNNISSADVEALVKPKLPDNVFALSDEILNKNKSGALKTFEQLMSSIGTDEKSAILKIVGLLAEQIRSLILVSKLNEMNMDQTEIAEKLGWSSGRVFMVSKHATKVNSQKLAKLLNKLLYIDLNLKSSENNPKLLLDLFIAEACT